MQKSREVIDSIVKEKTGILFSLCHTILFIDFLKNGLYLMVPYLFLFCFVFVLVVYGITTGFGKFARTVIPVNKLE